MASSEFKTAAAKLLDQHGVKKPAAATIKMQADSATNEIVAEPVMIVQEPEPARSAEKIKITMPLLLGLAKTRLSLGLAVVCCALMWLVVPELLIPKSFKIFNAVLGIIIGLTYGIILAFPHQREGGDKS